MDITPVVSSEKQLVGGYGDGGFTITAIRYEGSVLVFPNQTVDWAVSSLSELNLDSFAPVLVAEPKPAILLLGCGKGMGFVPREIRAALKDAGVVIESMDTGAACRTYNVLLTEGRDVAAALIAV